MIDDTNENEVEEIYSQNPETEYLKNSGGNNISENSYQSRNFHDDLHNPNLFNDNSVGDYSYNETPYGKHAEGSLTLADGNRNPVAQREVGGVDRRADDDGGHLIGNRFGGSGEKENMDAQNRNLNRGSYKINENDLAESLESGNKVFTSRDTFKSNGSERPDAFMGYNITEHPDGSRFGEAFSYQNESSATQEAWAKESGEEVGNLMDETPNAMDDVYSIHGYNAADYDESPDNAPVTNESSENDELSKNEDMSEGGNIENDGEGLSDDIANTVNGNTPEEDGSVEKDGVNPNETLSDDIANTVDSNTPEEDGGVEKDEINQNEAPSDDIANTVNDNAPEEDGGVEKDEINQNETPSDDIANMVNGNTPEEDGGVEKDGAGQSEMPSSNGGPSNNDGNSLSSVEDYGLSQ